VVTTDLNEIRESYGRLVQLLQKMVNDLTAEVRRQEGTTVEIPDWDSLQDQKLLFTKMSEVAIPLERIQRCLAAAHALRASLKKIELNTKGMEFQWRSSFRERISYLLEISSDLEKSLVCYRDVLDRKSKQLTAAQFMQTNQRYMP
jgi:hypothetical protein